MTDFEFLSVLVSIVVGFGLTHLLGGLGRAYHFRRTSKMDAVHFAWTIMVFFVLVLNWWVFLLWRDFNSWTFFVFFTIIMWTTSMFPPRLSKDVDYRVLFETNRTWFLSTFVVFSMLDILVTALREQTVPELYFMAFVGHFAIIAALGILIRNRRYDLVAAWYIVITMALWSFGVRSTLF